MFLSVSHTTTYKYQETVPYGVQQIRLTPKPYHGQQVIKWDTIVEGGRIELEYQDHNLNTVQLIKVYAHQKELTVTCEGRVETADNAGILGKHISHIPLWLYRRSTPLTLCGAGVRRIIKSVGRDFDDQLTQLHALSKTVYENVSYQTGQTAAQTTAEQALSEGAGVCQDHAHIFISAARKLGLPARYVSGYLMMDDRVDQDATHAWAEAHIDDLGWVGFDISNQISPDERYIRVASGLDYSDCAPITGMRVGSGQEDMIVSVQVQQ